MKLSFMVCFTSTQLGIGNGLYIIPARVIPMHYFTKKRAIASGISSVGLSVGNVIWPPTHRRFIHMMGWRGGMLIFSALMLNSLTFAFLLRPIRQFSRPNTADSPELLDRTVTTSSKEVTQWARLRRCMNNVTGISLLTNWRFLFYALYRSATNTGWVVVLLFCIRRAIYLGVDPLRASLLFSLCGGASGIGRVIGGAIGNTKCVNCQLLCTTCSIVAGGLMMSSGIIPDTFEHNAPYHTLLGLFIGK